MTDVGRILTGELHRVSIEQVSTIIGNTIRGKSPGHDGLSAERLHFYVLGTSTYPKI